MEIWKPTTAADLAQCLRQAAEAKQSIQLLGNNSKSRAGGTVGAADVQLLTTGLDQVLQYQPKDLTVSVGAGMSYAKFTAMLAQDGYMVPIDPPFAASATVGGVVAANCSGPRRRLYGTPRDLVIGMQFATLEGKLIQSGGMVVKNVAGLDMGKLLIGSMGTLGAIASVNFKLTPLPVGTQTFLYVYDECGLAIAQRDTILQGVLTPSAIDLIRRDGRYLLALGCSGNAAVLDRYSKEFAGAQVLDGAAEQKFWHELEEAPALFLAENPDGCIVRLSVRLGEVRKAVEQLPGTVVARAANGVCYAYCDTLQQAFTAMKLGQSVMEYGPTGRGPELVMWPETDTGFAMMQKIKIMFDPDHLLNRGRMYGRF